jgi:hypothetical protein
MGEHPISLITTLKPFKGLARIHQINSLQSWAKFIEGAEIIVVGESEGFETILSEFKFNIKWVKEVKTSYSGAPYLDDMIKKGLENARYDFVCIINADTILLSDFVHSISKLINIYDDNFLLTSRSFPLNINTIIDFDQPEVEACLKYKARKRYIHRDITSLPTDFYFFHREFLSNAKIPPFIYGRGVFVRWYIYHAHCKRIPIIDATPVITAIHQTHSFDYIKDHDVQEELQKVQDPYKALMKGKEFRWNLEIAGPAAYFSGADFTHILTERGLVKINSLYHLVRYLLKKPLLPPYSKISFPLIKALLPSRTVRSFTKQTLRKLKLFY